MRCRGKSVSAGFLGLRFREGRGRYGAGRSELSQVLEGCDFASRKSGLGLPRFVAASGGLVRLAQFGARAGRGWPRLSKSLRKGLASAFKARLPLRFRFGSGRVGLRISGSFSEGVAFCCFQGRPARRRFAEAEAPSRGRAKSVLGPVGHGRPRCRRVGYRALAQFSLRNWPLRSLVALCVAAGGLLPKLTKPPEPEAQRGKPN